MTITVAPFGAMYAWHRYRVNNNFINDNDNAKN